MNLSEDKLSLLNTVQPNVGEIRALAVDDESGTLVGPTNFVVAYFRDMCGGINVNVAPKNTVE